MRDELKFTKFIGRLRKRFSELFNDILKTQLELKGIISPEDWEDMEEHIQYDFLFDNHFNELKNLEILQQRINIVTQMDPFMGRYFSIEDARRNVLMQTEEEYKLISKQMKAEIESGAVMDPIDINTVDMMTKQNDALAPEIEADAAEKEREGQAKLAAQNAKLSASNTKKPDSSK